MPGAATFSLDQIRTASPCPVRWSDMTGDDTKRFCKHCKLHVYNLTTMTRADAEALILGAEGRLCAMYYRRADGTVLAGDCPAGERIEHAKRLRRLRALAAVAGLWCAAIGSWALGPTWWHSARTRLDQLEPFQTMRTWIYPPSPFIGTLF